MKEVIDEVNVEISKSSSSEEWLTSYSDLVTVLLCFFILFFIMKAKFTQENMQEALNSKKVDKVLAAIGDSMEASKSNKKLDMRRLHQYIQVIVKHEKLFQGEELTVDARYQLASLAEATFKYTPEIVMQISTPLKNKNFEAEQESFFRALKIRNYLEGLGISGDLISVGNYQSGVNEGDPQEEVRIMISRNISTSGEL